jgi:hypothetical protein
MTKEQSEATKHIKDLLASRGLKLEPGIILVAEEGWKVFEYGERCIGIDPSSGVWVSGESWRFIASPCTVSAALEAIEFLIGG